jgi:hypothetical protein
MNMGCGKSREIGCGSESVEVSGTNLAPEGDDGSRLGEPAAGKLTTVRGCGLEVSIGDTSNSWATFGRPQSVAAPYPAATIKAAKKSFLEEFTDLLENRACVRPPPAGWQPNVEPKTRSSVNSPKRQRVPPRSLYSIRMSYRPSSN